MIFFWTEPGLRRFTVVRYASELSDGKHSSLAGESRKGSGSIPIQRPRPARRRVPLPGPGGSPAWSMRST